MYDIVVHLAIEVAKLDRVAYPRAQLVDEQMLYDVIIMFSIIDAYNIISYI